MLRNKVNSQLRSENVAMNSERIKKVENKNETWKIAGEIRNPLQENAWSMSDKDGSKVTDEQTIANNFNNFFTEKINNIKKEIDPKLVQDPLTKLKEKMEKKVISTKH